MHVHIDIPAGQLEKQRQHGVAVARQHVAIGTAHRAGEQSVLHRTSVDKQILMIGDTAIVGRQAGNTTQPHGSAFQRDGNAVVFQFARNDLRNPVGQNVVCLQREYLPSAMLQ